MSAFAENCRNLAIPTNPYVAVILDCDASFLTCTAYYRGVPAGIAKFTIGSGNVELGDIEVYERGPHWWRPARLVGFKCNYRRRGIGADMMAAALEYLRGIGASDIYGVLGGGDAQAQRSWYSSLGFHFAGSDRVFIRL